MEPAVVSPSLMSSDAVVFVACSAKRQMYPAPTVKTTLLQRTEPTTASCSMLLCQASTPEPGGPRVNRHICCRGAGNEDHVRRPAAATRRHPPTGVREGLWTRGRPATSATDLGHGRADVARRRERFRGQFRQGKDAPWMDMTAEQYNFYRPPSRLFS